MWWGERAHGHFDMADVVGRGTATAAYQPHAGVDEPPRVRRHVLRRTQVDVAPLDLARTARVRLRGQFDGRDLGHALDGFEHRRGTDAAIHADNVGAEMLELR